MEWITIAMVLAVWVVAALSCISDVRHLKIPNWHSLAVIACFFPAYFFAAPETFEEIWRHLAAMLIMFVVTYLMFIFRMMGGGDSKLGSAFALWVGLKGLFPFLLYMAFIGGIVGVVSLVMKKVKPFSSPDPESWAGQVQAGKNAVPYGIAIAGGAVIAFFHTGISQAVNEVFKIIH